MSQSIQRFPMVQHIQEIRWRCIYILYSFCATSLISSYYAYELLESISFLEPSRRLIYIHLSEAFMTTLQFAVSLGCWYSIPMVLYHSWAFIVPGLYQYEKTSYTYFISMIISSLLFGTWMAVSCLMPILYDFFLQFEVMGAMEFELRATTFISFITSWIFVSTLLFLLPTCLLTYLLITSHDISYNIPYKNKKALLKVPSVKHPLITLWIKHRPTLCLLAFIFGALMSPPDVLSQCCLAFLCLLTFEIILWIYFCIIICRSLATSISFESIKAL